MGQQTGPAGSDDAPNGDQDELSNEELCDALQDAAERGNMTDYDGLANEAVRRFTEFVAEGMAPRRESMIGEFDTRDNPHIEIGRAHYDETFTSIDFEGCLSWDGRPVMVDFFHDEPRLYVYSPDNETPVFTVRFPTSDNDVKRPTVLWN